MVIKSKKYLALGALIIASIVSCQKDPILEEIKDGNVVVTPKSKAFVTGISVSSHPEFDPSGNLWDVIDSSTLDTLGRPDIFFNITEPSNLAPVFWSQNSHFLNCGTNDTVSYLLPEPFSVLPFGSTIAVNLYDYELPDSTFMETFDFFVGTYSDPANPYPSALIQTKNGYTVAVGIRWED